MTPIVHKYLLTVTNPKIFISRKRLILERKEFIIYILKKRLDIPLILLAMALLTYMNGFNIIVLLFICLAIYMIALILLDIVLMEVRQVTGKVVRYDKVKLGNYFYRIVLETNGKISRFGLDKYRENCIGEEVTIKYFRFSKTVVGISEK